MTVASATSLSLLTPNSREQSRKRAGRSLFPWVLPRYSDMREMTSTSDLSSLLISSSTASSLSFIGVSSSLYRA
ncbi:MAG: hypothetical protein JRG75_12330 [Deltaproteobacteria bacterium]|nr:hypothetical protein [Deltaproteobacteria bacterium]